MDPELSNSYNNIIREQKLVKYRLAKRLLPAVKNKSYGNLQDYAEHFQKYKHVCKSILPESDYEILTDIYYNYTISTDIIGVYNRVDSAILQKWIDDYNKIR